MDIVVRTMPRVPTPPSPAPGRPLPSLTFLLALLALAAIALAVLFRPPRIVTGLPEGPEVARVRALVRERLQVDAGGLRFQSALLDELGAPDVGLAIEAERLLSTACERSPGDPRLLAGLACLNLAAQRHDRAERLYRQALDRAPTYGEARLGLGVTLALRADAAGDEGRARGLRLRAISQLASVPEQDPVYEPALYDRTLLLMRVRRMDEARRCAAEYARRDSAGVWTLFLRRELDADAR
jgi:tetratricopeptide (TPR) repeat protein